MQPPTPCCFLLQVFEWLTWAAAELSLVTDEKLQHINSHLGTRTFLAGNCTSLADLVVFGIVHPAVVSSETVWGGMGRGSNGNSLGTKQVTTPSTAQQWCQKLI